jgi:hypothetical protein
MQGNCFKWAQHANTIFFCAPKRLSLSSETQINTYMHTNKTLILNQIEKVKQRYFSSGGQITPVTHMYYCASGSSGWLYQIHMTTWDLPGTSDSACQRRRLIIYISFFNSCWTWNPGMLYAYQVSALLPDYVPSPTIYISNRGKVMTVISDHILRTTKVN